MDKHVMGGVARAESLSEQERSDIASVAAKARWEREKLLPKATHQGEIRIRDIVLPCAVLTDGTRVISELSLNSILGTSGGGKQRQLRKASGVTWPLALSSKALEPFLPLVFEENELTPIEYKDGRRKAKGYDAKILPKMCDVWLRARDAKVLQEQQLHKAYAADMLMRGLAEVGIVALVDEATGYQDEREKNELHRLLSVYLSEERLAWAKRFPDEFYKQIYRLHDWHWPSDNNKHPGYVGKLTNQLVYERLPSGVLDELRVRNPKKEGSGQRQWRHHQFLSEDIGQNDLRDHLLQIIMLMRISKDWSTFMAHFESAFPSPGQQLSMDLSKARKR
ncbi:P63C domain-containing protein [Pseudomonas putida]|uniref:P63C domain-containing protein n=1 Tax=Pseudomonas putida TaxID=303 RepID=UPI00276B06D3|nr:P63C domain-containing protein [Pseudomonas putida]MDP9522409.1 P63C domain-containing protein [Pseudomonas putida]